MTKASRRLLTHCALLVAAAFTAQTTPSFGARDSLAVVVAKTFPADGLSLGDLKRLYMGNPVTAGGKTLIPLTYPKQASERTAFDQSVLGMSPDEVGRYWIDRKIRGQSGAPKTVDSAEVVMKVVAKVDGAIGYVRNSAATQTVKTLRIDGKLPTDPGYRISNRTRLQRTRGASGPIFCAKMGPTRLERHAMSPTIVHAQLNAA